jgi:two-component system cell cycle response regulator
MRATRAGARVLLVEDTPHNLLLMTYLLESYGHTVIPAGTGEEGIELAATARPDLVVMDLQLPGIDGYEALAALRSMPDLDGVPVVAVTSFAMVGDRDRALNAGFNDYLAKPIDPENFGDEISSLLPERLCGSRTVPPGEEPAQSTEPAFPGPADDHHAADILVLDDSILNQTLLRSMLEPHGYHVRTASTVQEAIAAAEESPPDLVLSDVHVGHENGGALLSYLRTVPVLTVVPFAFISATTDWQAGSPEAGEPRIIRRPIEPSALLDEVRTLLNIETGA